MAVKYTCSINFYKYKVYGKIKIGHPVYGRGWLE